jgi:hypothetical protein
MKRKSRKQRRPIQIVRVWTRPNAEKALPLLRSVMTSLREHWIEARAHYFRGLRKSLEPGRPDRNAILAHQSAVEESGKAEERFNEALAELMALDIYCLDPGRGLALVPFANQQELAWFVFDLFAPEGLVGWRYQHDPLDTRRPLTETAPPGDTPALAG